MSRGKSKKFSDKELNDQFDAFLRESISSEESTLASSARGDKRAQGRSSKQPWWAIQEEEDDDDSQEIGLTGTGKQFLKKTPSAVESAMSTKKKGQSKSVKFGGSEEAEIGLSRDSLDEETDNYEVGRTGMGESRTLGKDTLEEAAEKERFFQEFEANQSRTVNYNKLNKDIDSSATLADTPADSRSCFGNTMRNENDSSDDSEADMEQSIGTGTLQAEGEEQLPSSPSKDNLLEKVALMDSLESTLGTKPAASHETDMQTILEGTQENEDSKDNVDGPSETDGGQATGKLKTGTAFGYTDTSHEIEALHNAMRQIGQSTMDDTKQFSFKDSSTIAEKTSYGTSDANNLGTGLFGMRGAGPKLTSGDRTMSDEAYADHDSNTSKNKTGRKTLISFKPQSDDALVKSDGFDISPEDEFAGPFDSFTSPDWKPAAENDDEIDLGASPVPVPAKRSKKPPSSSLVKVDSSEKRAKKSKYQDVRSSGYGQNKTKDKSVSKENKPRSPVREMHKTKTKGTRDLNKKRTTNEQSQTIDDNVLMSSIQSFANYIQSQLSVPKTEAEHPQDAPSFSDLQDLWREEKKKLAKLQTDIAYREREFERKLQQNKMDYDQQIFKLKQENYVLLAKISSAEEDKLRLTGNMDNSDVNEMSTEQVMKLEREIKEQETILHGYQAENERLYNESKKAQLSAKSTEQQMFKENQKLNIDLALTKEQLSQREAELKHLRQKYNEAQQNNAKDKPASLSEGYVTNLEVELKSAKDVEEGLKKDIHSMMMNKRVLELQKEDLTKKVTELENNNKMTISENTLKIQELQTKHELEVQRLNKKVKWYAENQDLLDRDAAALKKQNEEIERLRLQLKSFNAERGKSKKEMNTRVSDSRADAKKIQDLERQVKEMEGIIKRRHPNSLPALMWAAGSETLKLPTEQYLESQIRQLEQQLEAKDEDGKRCLRIMEQKYNAMKSRYEERIRVLEESIARPLSDEKKTVNNVDNSPKKQKNSETEQQQEIDALQLEIQNHLAKKGLNKTVVVHPKVKQPDANLPQSDRTQTNSDVVNGGGGTHSTKHYDPNTFGGKHISDILMENQNLKLEVERINLELKHQQAQGQNLLAEAERRNRNVHAETEGRIAAIHETHLSEIRSLMAKQAVHHSGSKVAELESKLETQLVISRHLKEQLARAEIDSKEFQAKAQHENLLAAEVKRLKEDLDKARESHTPELRHFEAMVAKIQEMENKHAQREKDFHKVIDQAHDVANAELEEEVEKWKRIVQIKNKETERFQKELDNILEVLKELQRQGVILPLKHASLAYK